MKILLILTYYRPYTSGLTIYVERLARGLVKRGHEVTVLTSHTNVDKNYPNDTVENEVRIVRAPVLAQIGKGVIMPTFGGLAAKLARENDVVSIHLPQFDAPRAAVWAKIFGKPVVLTYHCDLKLPPGTLNLLTNQIINITNNATGYLADRIVAYTKDFAKHSPYLKKFQNKVEIISPPVEIPAVDSSKIEKFAQKHYLKDKKPIIGMATRLATEKGVEILLTALPEILDEYPQTQVLFAGQYKGVLGEENYAQKLKPLLDEFQNCWRFLGTLDPSEMVPFYTNLDILAVPSLNSTESFGLVQVEAMLCGTPVIASNLPGVRVPIQKTGMGRIVPIGDSRALAKAVIKIIENKEDYLKPREVVESFCNTGKTIKAYEDLFRRPNSQPRLAYLQKQV